MEYTVHANQQAAGRSVVRALEDQSNDTRHVLLLAQMQMGKSGTYWFAILNLLFNKSTRGFKRVLLISGNRESELLRQVQQDKRGYVDWFFSRDSVKNGCTPDQIERMRARADRNIRIVWGTDLDKKSAPTIKPDTLVVWDESHFAQSKDNKPYEFLCRNGLQHLLNADSKSTNKGNCLENVRLLTVSATPFSELLTGGQKDHFKVVRLEPGVRYCGVKHYCDNKLIRPSFPVNAATRELLKETLMEYARPHKYVVLRLQDNRASVDITREVCGELDLQCKLYNSKRKDLSLQDMTRAPERPTVVVISGMLRMGKVMPKDHISMVFEAGTKAEKRHSDTTLQGLLGRVCGYTDRPGGFDIAVFVESNIMEYVDEYIRSYDSPEGPIVGNAMNVRPCPPEKRSLKPYHAIPLVGDNLEPPLTKLGNVRPSMMKAWLREKMDAGHFSPEVTDRLSQLLQTSLTTIAQRDINRPTNSWLARVVYECCADGTRKATAYKTAPECEIYFTRAIPEDGGEKEEEGVMWMVLRSVVDDHEFYVEQEGEGADPTTYYVLDKCVFKLESQNE